MFGSILVSYDGSPAARAALEQAFDLARAENANLTVLTVAPAPPPLATLAGMSRQSLAEDVARWASRLAREAAEAAPADVAVHTVERSGHVGREILRELRVRHYDLVVLGSRGRNRFAALLLGSVNGYLRFRTHTPLLAVEARS